MEPTKKTTVSDGEGTAENYAPRKMTFADNLILTIKIFAIAGAILAAVWGIAGWQSSSWPAWFPVLVFLPFIADASLTLIRRIMQGKRIWEPHRTHFYQRLTDRGWSHLSVAALWAAFATAVSLPALFWR